MNKPLMVARQDFIQSLIGLINNSNLPLAIVQPLLSNTLREVREAMEQQYRAEKQQYEAALQEEENKETKEE